MSWGWKLREFVIGFSEVIIGVCLTMAVMEANYRLYLWIT